MPAKRFHLADLLRPTPPEKFFGDNWEKRPLAIARRDDRHYAGLLSLCDVDQIIAFTRPRFTDAEAFRATRLGRTTYVRGVLDAPPASPEGNPGIAELRQVFDQGKSVVIMSMQRRWPAVAELCRSLEATFHCPVHANLYLTPPGSQGFAAHFDPHEVFVLQLEGAKTWRVYERAAALPLPSDNGGAPALPLGPLREVPLVAGDLLYLPRGHVHEAFTAETFSMHLTVGVNVYRWADLLHHALAGASRHDLRLRESIPGGALPGDATALKEHFRRLLFGLANHPEYERLFEEAMHSLGDQFFGQLPMLPGSQFAAEVDLDPIALDTVLENGAQGLCRVVGSGSGVAIEFPGNHVGGPQRIAAALRFIAGAKRFTVRDLPDDLNSQAKVVLVRRLVREGLLIVADWRSSQNGAGLESTSQNASSVERPSSRTDDGDAGECEAGAAETAGNTNGAARQMQQGEFSSES